MTPHKRLLIAEDEPALRRLLASTLTREGYIVDAFDNGIEACKSADAHPPDAVLCDLLLPGRDAYTVVLHLRSRRATRRTPVLILMGESTPEQVEIAQQLGAQGCVCKSCELAELIHAVEEAVRERE